MSILWAASLRHLMRHPAQLALAFIGLSVAVGSIVAVDIATASAARAFEQSLQAVNGPATHDITAGPPGVDENLYVRLRRAGTVASLFPVVEGYATVGDRALQLVGIDPFASPLFDAAREQMPGSREQMPGSREPTSGSPGQTSAILRDPQKWLTQSGGVVMSSRSAGELGLHIGSSFTLEAGGNRRSATVIGIIPPDRVGYDTLLLTDLAQAQEWLGLVGYLSRIDVGLPAGESGERAAALLRTQMPAGAQLKTAAGRARQSLDMTVAFTTNLQAMSLLALLVSALLIYGAVSFAVVQRRRLLGVLRALGATRAEVLRIVLTEGAVLGLAGAAAGVLVGVLIGRGLVALVSQTINDLYFVVAVNETILPVSSVIKALAAGLGTSLAGALLPGLEVVASAPQLALRRSVLEVRAARLARRLFAISLLLAVSCLIVALVSGRSLFWGFVSLFLLLLSVAAMTPAVLGALARAAASLAGRVSPVARLAFADISTSLSRTGVAVAALGMAVAAMIGVSIMVESFRESLRDWLAHTMRADIYVTAPGPDADSPDRQIQPEIIRRVTRVPEIASYSLSRRAGVDLPTGPVTLDALQIASGHPPGLPLLGRHAADVWEAFRQGAVLVSEPLAWRLQLNAGQTLKLQTASGEQPFRIAAVYREYGDERGSVMIDLSQYRKWWGDDRITGLGLYLAAQAQTTPVLAEIHAAVHGQQTLLIRSNAQLRELSMRIFERTFVITRVLYWLAAGVAAIGLISALLAWELQRSHEIALLRSLGLTPGGAAWLLEAQTGFMGLVALLAAIPAGLLTAFLLIEVINRRAFGWQIDLHVTPAQLANALLLSLAAALVAGIYPAWRCLRAPIATEIREE